MTVDAFVALLWRRRLLVALLTVLGGALGFGSAQVIPQVYSATATSFVTAVPSADKGASYDSTQFAVSRAKSYSPLLESPEVLSGVIEELKLQLTPAQLDRQLEAENPTDTLLINVTAKASSPGLAKRIADSASRHLAAEIETLETGGNNQRISPVDIQLAVPAPVPSAPDSPQPVVNSVLGLLLGFALAALATLSLAKGPKGRSRPVTPQPQPSQWWNAPRHVRGKAAAHGYLSADAQADNPQPEPVKPEPVKAEPVRPGPVTAAPVKPQPVRPGPVTAAPAKPQPVRPGPVTAAPVKPQPVRPGPVTAAPAKPQPVRPEPVKPEPVKPQPVRPGPVTAAPAKPQPVRPEPVKPEPVKPQPVRPEPVTAAPAKPQPVRPEPVTAELVRVEPVTAELVTADPVTADPVTADPVPGRAERAATFGGGTATAQLLNGAKPISRDTDSDAPKKGDAPKKPVPDPATRQIPLPALDQSAATGSDKGTWGRAPSTTEREHTQKQPQP